MKYNGEIDIYRMLRKNHDADDCRAYEIINSKAGWAINLNIPKILTVDDLVHALNLFIESLQRNGFETPLVAIQGQPQIKEENGGMYLFFDTRTLGVTTKP